jgi:L-ribulose-5-phosphate 4-epimerase
MKIDKLKKLVYKANLDLVKHGLVIFTWGNVSMIDRKRGVVAIKPSGVSYETMTEDDIVLVDLEGNVVEGDKNPSSDTPTHVLLYKEFPEVGGIVHTHSTWATVFAQAQREIPCFGTTHADYFYGDVPVARPLNQQEIEGEYEKNTGIVIADTFKGLNPMHLPGVLVANHGPFAWGSDADNAVHNAVVLEQLAKMAYGTLTLCPESTTVPDSLKDKHFLRKHGENAYYGQKTNK